MRVVLQRVSRASIRVHGAVRGTIEEGVLLLVGIAPADGEAEVNRLAGKVARLRIFPDGPLLPGGKGGRFDRSLLETGGRALVVSQFTLLADTGKGNRPSFGPAAAPEHAEPLVERFAEALRALGIAVETGVFGAAMEVELVNDGPVTLVLDG